MGGRRPAAGAEVTEDALIGRRVRLRQPGRGYRVAVDPVLLAAAVPAGAGHRVLDLGTGVGAAALCLAVRVAGCRVTGLELDPALARLANENAALNGLSERVRVIAGDVRAPPAEFVAAGFDEVMLNPPHLAAAGAAPSPDPGKAAADVEGEGAELAVWLDQAHLMTRPRAGITVIHRAERLGELLAGLGGRAGDVRVFPLWPRADRPAKRVIVRARKGSAAPLRLCPGLVLHGPDGRFTAPAEAVLRDGAGLAL
ncbi:MAG: tRNA1(Val) (adenine(37)-N6)-methyltransferase [Kiloniellales bacterium]